MVTSEPCRNYTILSMSYTLAFDKIFVGYFVKFSKLSDGYLSDGT